MRWWWAGVILLAGYVAVEAEAVAQADQGIDFKGVDFNRDIRPILSDNCFQCHGPDEAQRQAEMRLDTDALVRSESESGGRLVVPGDVKASVLYQRLTADDDERMPPPDSGKALTRSQIEQIKQWIDQGAEWNQHWSFSTPQRPPLPKLDGAGAPNPIDRFVLARLEKETLRSSPPADRVTLLRRVTFDLIGLPPSFAEIDTFLNDESPDAYERQVDRLLQSPRYGEHQARVWLDAARYGDTHGLHLDNVRSMWLYRDWTIRALNANMPFDEFTVEQLAGDLLPNPTLEQRIATGFNRCNVTTSEGGAIDQEYLVRYAIDRVKTTSTVWMGLTTGCAVCHEHKFDPISQKEFYQLFAYYFSLTEKAMDGNALLPPPIVRLASPEQSERLAAMREDLRKAEQSIHDALTGMEYTDPENDSPEESLLAWEQKETKNDESQIPEKLKNLLGKQPDARSDGERSDLRNYFLQHVYLGTREQFEPLQEQLNKLTEELQSFEQTIPATLVMEDMPTPRDAHILVRGQYDRPGEKVTPGVPAILPPLPQEAAPNRLSLAHWLVTRDHPLTARVTVNRYWQQFFGVGLVKTSEDFGSQGEWPSHPELLDWLAVDFIDSGWSVKRLHRLIVTSATYRRSSHASPRAFVRDPENRLMARGPRFRLDAETIRDAALAISGLMVTKIGGPSVKPYQPDGLWRAVGYSGSNTVNFERDDGDALYRRSMYTFWKRTAPPPSMQTFDAPSRESCTVRRPRTNTPLQALALLNDEQFVEAARAFGHRIMKESGPAIDARVRYGFRLATTRWPKDDELQLLREVYESHWDRFQANPDAARDLIGVGASTADPSLEVSALAAWTMVANIILNLSETITKG